MFLIDSISSQAEPRRPRTETMVSVAGRSLGSATLAVFALFFLLAPTTRAQSNVDGFHPSADGTIWAIALQADGKILVGGGFTELAGNDGVFNTRNHIGRLNKDGTLDQSFDPGANGTVSALVVQPNGQILVGGSFTTLGGDFTGATIRNNIGRLNADGTVDAGFDPNANDSVQTLVRQSDGKIIMGGDFSMVQNTARASIARLNTDGTLDASFDPGTDGSVLALVVQGDGKILVGGSFTTLGGGGSIARSNIGRLNADGTIDAGFVFGANGIVRAVVEQTSGKVVVGGNFTTLGVGTGTAMRNFIGRFNVDASVDASFNPGTDNEVYSLALQASGKILVGGLFANMGGGIGNVARSDIGRLSPNGALDTTFNPGANDTVRVLLEETPGEILVGGSFNTLGGGGSGTATREFIGRLAPFVPPVITSPLEATTTINQQFVYQFLASNASSLDVTNLPAGLNFDSNLGVISGMPQDFGTFSIGLSASNEDGDASATLTLTVQPFPTSGPAIIGSMSATGRTGQPFLFQVVTQGASPAARVSATGLPAGLKIDPVTGEITGSATNDGSSAVTLTVTDGSLTTMGTLELTFSSDPDLPVITSPTQAFLVAGEPLNYQIATSSQNPFEDIDYDKVFALPAGLGLNQATGLISGVFPGSLGPRLSGGVVTNVQLFATNSSGTATSPLTFFVLPAGARNISTRLLVGTDDDVLIGGFIITGNAPKKVLIRAIGPSLKSNGVALPGRLLDPTLELHDKDGLLDSNDNWRSSQEQEIINTTIPPPNNNESAIVAVLSPLDPAIPNSGAYTVIVKGKNKSTGIALVEVYDLGTASFDVSSESHLANISTRGDVETGDDVMIGGFILGGSDPSNVLLRAIGPELTTKGVAGALQDTVLELRDANGALVSSNDDWQSTQKQQIIDTGVPPTDPRESAIVATLNPGNYTGIVRGKNNTTGVALVEVYVLP